MRSANASAPTRFARQDHFPQGWQTCVAQFLELFHRYSFICKPLTGGSWFSPDERWKLQDAEILKAVACVHPRFFIGCRAGKTTRFAVLDIDQSSRYHNKQSLDKLLKVLADAGLSKSSLYRSSFSGGWHLYLFFEEPINSANLRKLLVKLLTLNDFQLSKGQLELFPHRGEEGSLGLGLRLPLQPGFAWLDKKTLEVEHERHDLTATQALELFIDVLDGDANSYEAFRKCREHAQELEERKADAIAHGLKDLDSNVIPLRRVEKPLKTGEFIDFVSAVFRKLPPGIIVDNWYKGRLYHLNGLSGPSQRAECIECLGHYFFYGDPSRDLPALGYGYEKEREWAISEFLLVHHNGQSKDINRGRADALAQVQRAANWRPAHKRSSEPEKYRPEQPVSWIRANVNKKLDARKRITAGLEEMKKLQRRFSTVDLRNAAKCSQETLYKHKDIWQKDYDDLADGFFAACTDEYNVVVGGGSRKTSPPTTSLEQDMPLGRLAARRIVYEISMRDDRTKKKAKKEAVRSLESSEKQWLGNVTRLTENDPCTLSIAELKSLLIVLVAYLAMAPNEESQNFIQERIAAIRKHLAEALKQPLQLVRPP